MLIFAADRRLIEEQLWMRPWWQASTGAGKLRQAAQRTAE